MSLLPELRADIARRDERSGWERRQVSWLPSGPEELSAALAPYARAWAGPAAVVIGDLRRRDVLDAEVTPGELARAYLRRLLVVGICCKWYYTLQLAYDHVLVYRSCIAVYRCGGACHFHP